MVKIKSIYRFRLFFIFSIYLRLFSSYLQAELDLEEMAQDFILETRQVKIPGYPDAFNPSIVRWNGSLLMSFRVIPYPPYTYSSWVGMVWLDEDFNPIGKPQILATQVGSSGSEDARLVTIGDDLWIVYSGNNELSEEEEVNLGGNSYGAFRVYVAQLAYDGQKFSTQTTECLSCFEGENKKRREKNWVPFDYKGNLLLAYSLSPHRIFRPLLTGDGLCETFACTQGSVSWNWGELRGGTPALLDDDHYLAFFHSFTDLKSFHSDGKTMPHYVMGAYTFSNEPPFEITRMSYEPIVGLGFYKGEVYTPYWHPVRVVFPCGLIHDDHFIWVTYGRQDHEVWIVKMDKRRLLKSLVPVSILQIND